MAGCTGATLELVGPDDFSTPPATARAPTARGRRAPIPTLLPAFRPPPTSFLPLLSTPGALPERHAWGRAAAGTQRDGAPGGSRPAAPGPAAELSGGPDQEFNSDCISGVLWSAGAAMVSYGWGAPACSGATPSVEERSSAAIDRHPVSLVRTCGDAQHVLIRTSGRFAGSARGRGCPQRRRPTGCGAALRARHRLRAPR